MIHVSVVARDATADSLAATDSVTIQNTPPTLGSVALPADPTTNQTISAAPAGFADDDLDSPTYHYTWYVNDTKLDDEHGASLDLSKPGNGSHGETIKVEVTATDGFGGTSNMVSTTTVVANTPPTLGSVALPAHTPAPKARPSRSVAWDQWTTMATP